MGTEPALKSPLEDRSSGLRGLSSATLRWLDEHATGGIVTTDESLIVRTWNQWLESVTGASAESVIGKPLLEAFPSIVERGLDRYYADALRGEVAIVAHTLHQYIFPDTRSNPRRGRMIQSGRIAPLQEEGQVIGTITIVEDVTDRVANERELRAQIATADAARLNAEAASRSKDEFLATLSHEIRTPLNAVLGWTRILRLREDVDPALVKRAVDVIERNAMAQLSLITDMLDMARIAAGKVRLEIAPIDLPSLTLAALDVVRPGADAKQVKLTTRFAPNLVPILGDADRLQQIIWNLLSNGVKFTEPGGSVTAAWDTDGTHVRLVVTDTGTGISPDFLPHVFERFRQAQGSSSRSHSGLGLGLALVKELAGLHGGTVSVESPGPGRGSTFTVSLPMRPAERSRVPLAEPAGNHDLSGTFVLILDDDADSREILERTIAGAGGGVVAASSSREALHRLSECDRLPDTIVTDIGMAGDDGYAFLQHLRLLPHARGGKIPAIALTAYASPIDRAQALTAGFVAHFTKPFDPGMLLQAIARIASPEASRQS
jgi:PAS domain S-box-containing protein